MSSNPLDAAVFDASKELRGRGAPEPEVLFLLGTGLGLLPSKLSSSWRLPLESIAGVPTAWRGATLIAGDVRGVTFWLIEDAPHEEGGRVAAAMPSEHAWARAFPVWLAACSGATICVHTSAGTALGDDQPGAQPPVLAFGSDHLNLSGQTPLLGLGESRLGALFPDQTTVHHARLRERALWHAERLGIPSMQGVLACTSGPSLETPAERVYFQRAGGDVAVQDLAAPLIAAAHSGLSCLSIVGLLPQEPGIDVRRLLEGAEVIAPALEELIEALLPDLAQLSLELREEV